MGPDVNSMQLTTMDIPHERVLALSGSIGLAQVPELRARLIEAVNQTDGDILIDTHQVTAFDDDALVAFIDARKRAKFLRHRILVLDTADGHVATSLRRTGMHSRLPVFPDAPTAAQHLAAYRRARVRLTLHHGSASRPEPARGTAPAVQPGHGAAVRAS